MGAARRGIVCVSVRLSHEQQCTIVLAMNSAGYLDLWSHEEGCVVKNSIVADWVLFPHERGHDGKDLREGSVSEAPLVERGGLSVKVLVLQEEMEVVEEALLERNRDRGRGICDPRLCIDKHLHGLTLQTLLEE